METVEAEVLDYQSDDSFRKQFVIIRVNCLQAVTENRVVSSPLQLA